jgi:hypothetical protein
MRSIILFFTFIAACATTARPFPLREPLAVDPDRTPFAATCRAAPTHKDPHAIACTPEPYLSSLAWDALDNTIFARVSRGLAVDVGAEAANANALDEVADSSWFQNRSDVAATGGCAADELLPDPEQVADGAWVIDHGKDDGSTLGFRVDIPGKGKYLLKADTPEQPERSSAASVIGMAVYHAVGFNTPCEQVVYLRPSQLTLKPGLTVTGNTGSTHAFDAKALAQVLASSSHRGELVRMEASKWLPGASLGPFRYEGTRDDDPNDVVPHENRRELRGSRVLAAWLNHYDAREQNSLDVWFANDAKHARSPGYITHYMLDASDVLGGDWDPDDMTPRLGNSYYLDFTDIATDFVTLGAIERPWDREQKARGHEKFGFFSAERFDPDTWKSGYPNPAFLRMTERDAAWMARIIARFTPDEIRAIVAGGKFTSASDDEYLAEVLLARQHAILARYFARLSPLADVHVETDGRICATDLARERGVFSQFSYDGFARTGDRRVPIAIDVEAAGRTCFAPRSTANPAWRDDDPRRIAVFVVTNGTSAHAIAIHTYDLDQRGFRVVGLERR